MPTVFLISIGSVIVSAIRIDVYYHTTVPKNAGIKWQTLPSVVDVRF